MEQHRLEKSQKLREMGLNPYVNSHIIEMPISEITKELSKKLAVDINSLQKIKSSVEIAEYKPGEKQEVSASFDGRHPVNLNEGDKIRIIRSDKVTKIMKLSKVSFLETLQKKMRIY